MAARALYVEPKAAPSPTSSVIQQARLPVYDESVVSAINLLRSSLTRHPYTSNTTHSFVSPSGTLDLTISSFRAAGFDILSDLTSLGYIDAQRKVITRFTLQGDIAVFTPGIQSLTACAFNSILTAAEPYPFMSAEYSVGFTFSTTVRVTYSVRAVSPTAIIDKLNVSARITIVSN